jgi:hypothetical protein
VVTKIARAGCNGPERSWRCFPFEPTADAYVRAGVSDTTIGHAVERPFPVNASRSYTLSKLALPRFEASN